jgi:hypothetical protein
MIIVGRRRSSDLSLRTERHAQHFLGSGFSGTARYRHNICRCALPRRAAQRDQSLHRIANEKQWRSVTEFFAALADHRRACAFFERRSNKIMSVAIFALECNE